MPGRSALLRLLTHAGGRVAPGLVYLNNRYHDPQLGVFISVDPLVAATGEPYIYASGNPSTLSDPEGLCPTGSAAAAKCYASLWAASPDSEFTVGGNEGRAGGGPGTTYQIEPSGVASPGPCGISSCPSPSSWCHVGTGGQGPCPSSVGQDHVFASDVQALLYLQDATGYATDFLGGALQEDALWATYNSPSGRRLARWSAGAGWLNRRYGIEASSAQTAGRVLNRVGSGLIVLGGVLEGVDQYQQDGDLGTGTRLFRAVGVGSTRAVFTWGGASGGMALAGSYCGAGATASCGGPVGTAIVIGLGGLVGGFVGDRLADVAIERVM